MKFTVVSLYRLSERLCRRGMGMAEARFAPTKFGAKREQSFATLMKRTVGLKLAMKTTEKEHPFTAVFKERKDTLNMNKPNARRAKKVCKLLMEYIEQVIVSGELGDDDEFPEFIVNRANLNDELSILSLYWDASGDEAKDAALQKKLDGIAHQLKGILTEAAIISTVPKITFVKDISRNRMNIIEEKLNSLELPPDYERSFVADIYHMSHEFNLKDVLQKTDKIVRKEVSDSKKEKTQP